MALNLTVHAPTVCIKDAVCAIPCSVENTYSGTYGVKVWLYENSTLLDHEPDLHYQDIPSGETYEFKGFWDTLTFKPSTVKTYNLCVYLTVPSGTLTSYDFSISCKEKPSFFDSLLASIGVSNKEQITDPMEKLFEAYAIPGFTVPPFICPFCGKEFKPTEDTEEAKDDATNAYIEHLAIAMNNFISNWFEAEE